MPTSEATRLRRLRLLANMHGQPIEESYRQLRVRTALALEARRFTTEIFPVDWRKDLDIAARQLAIRLRDLGTERRVIHVVAHSQGALVARRAIQLVGEAEAQRTIAHLVLLGPVNYGS